MTALTHARHRATPTPASGSLVALWVTVLLLSTFGWTAAQVLLPTLAGWRPVVIVSGSMLPRIHPGDVLSVQPGTAALRIGDVVTFHSPENPGIVLTHRLAGRTAGGLWLTKGDANPTTDPLPLPTANIIGRPRLLVADAGLLTYWRSTGQNRKLTGAVGGAALLALLGWLVVRGNGAPGSADAPDTSPAPARRRHPARHATTTLRRP